MTRPTDREGRKKLFLAQAMVYFDAMEDWYDEHPSATFEEIERHSQTIRRQTIGKSIGALINGRSIGKQETILLCPTCEARLRYKGIVPKHIEGIEGETTLERAYYHCPNKCEEGRFFPSG